MSNFTIGRIGLDVDLDDVSQWDMTGGTVSVAFSTPIDTQENANRVRQQLLGYVNGADEEFVAVTWADDPDVDGFYRIQSASVTPDPDLAFDGLYYFQMQMIRVGTYAAPIIDTHALIAGRPYASSEINLNPEPRFAVTAASQDVAQYDPAENTFKTDPNPLARTLADGTTMILYNMLNGSSFYSINPVQDLQYSVPPGDYYDGAVTLEVDDHVVVGREIRNRPVGWRISNGLVRVYADDIGGYLQLFSETFRNGGWTTPWRVDPKWGLGAGVRGFVQAPHVVSVIENTPAMVTVRIVCRRPDARTPLLFDITLRRGMYHVAVRMHSPVDTDSYPSIVFPNGEISNATLANGRFRAGYLYPGGTLAGQQYASNPKLYLQATGWNVIGGNGIGRQVFTGPISEIVNAYLGRATAAHAAGSFGVKAGQVGQNEVTAGVATSLSIYARCTRARALIMLVRWFNGGTQVGADAFYDTTSVAANTWERFEAPNLTPPATSNRVEVGIVGAGGTAWTVGDDLYVTGLLIEKSATVNTYWDGDSGSDAVAARIWVGDEHASESRRYTPDETRGQFLIAPYHLARTGTAEYYPAGTGGSTTAVETKMWDFAFGVLGEVSSGESWDRETQMYLAALEARETAAVR